MPNLCFLVAVTRRSAQAGHSRADFRCCRCTLQPSAGLGPERLSRAFWDILRFYRDL